MNENPPAETAPPSLPEIKPELVTADSIIGPLLDSMPEPTSPEPLIEATPEIENNGAAPPPENHTAGAGTYDKAGKAFDPSLHAADEKGIPRLNKRGFFVSKFIGRGGAKKRVAESDTLHSIRTAEQINEDGDTTDPAPIPAASPSVVGSVPDRFDLSAEMYLQTGYGIAASFFTNDIRPEDTTEHESIKIPLAACLRKRNSEPLSPEALLALAVAAFIAKKSAKETVREKFVLLYLRVKGWFQRFKTQRA